MKPFSLLKYQPVSVVVTGAAGVLATPAGVAAVNACVAVDWAASSRVMPFMGGVAAAGRPGLNMPTCDCRLYVALGGAASTTSGLQRYGPEQKKPTKAANK